jgi:hypothetical protein
VRVALVLFVFFREFTVGIAMVAALFLAEVVYWFRYVPVRRAVFGRWLAIALGVLVAFFSFGWGQGGKGQRQAGVCVSWDDEDLYLPDWHRCLSP